VALTVAIAPAVLAIISACTPIWGTTCRRDAASGEPRDGCAPAHRVDVSATPELDSLALFGSGALGLASYGLIRWRARRGVDRPPG